jgi:hypothetical protein
MFLRRVRAARFAAAYLLFTGAFVLMVPKSDVPETRFDEANTSTNEVVVQKDASFGVSTVGHRACAKNVCAVAEDQCPQNFSGLRRSVD